MREKIVIRQHNRGRLIQAITANACPVRKPAKLKQHHRRTSDERVVPAPKKLNSTYDANLDVQQISGFRKIALPPQQPIGTTQSGRHERL
jgi:hypothetical protein